MDEITKTGALPINVAKTVYVKVCSTCKEAFRTNRMEENTCGDCLDQQMDEEWAHSDCGSPWEE